MAGPRVKVGTLDQHAATAAKLAKDASKANTKMKRVDQAKHESRNKTPVDDDSDSDSSEGDSDNESTAAPDSGNWAARFKKTKTNVKSKETVSDSEDSSDSDSGSDSESDAKNKGATVKARSTSSSGSESDSSSVAKSETDTKMTNTEDVSESGSGSSSEDDSDSSEREAEVTKKKAPATANPASKAKNSASSSDDEAEASESSESGSEEESEDEVPAKTKPQVGGAKLTGGVGRQVIAPATGKEASKGDAMEVDSEEGSDSEDKDDSSKAIEKRNGNTAAPPATEFVGQDFQLRQAVDGVDAAEVAKIFRNAKSEGKQLWYFTVPAALPIEVIQEHAIPLEKIRAGAPIVAYDGDDYTASPDSVVDTSITVIIPNKAGNKYQTLNRSVERTIHIRKVMRFNDEDTAAAVASVASAPKIPRPQPKGLKARYQPLGVPAAPMGKIGFDASSDGEEDVEMDEAPLALPSSETPKTANKKRKHGAVETGTPNQDEPGSASTKKSKKARVGASESTPAASSTAKKHTPIAPPSVPAMNGMAGPPASSPVLSTRKVPGSPDKLPSTQPAMSSKIIPKKITPVAPPKVPGSKN
ncbi:DNA-directed RNA polymerase I subunit RPA34.5-domain-containing protein [Podospora aff. communis PSN243]|uniref:DNA-directed RNA polymerase I subunit RPA34.5-domain-containing protein n=1 Tax=Podospora aff. communis PSN243 TaxID=3040156 RepID=A0AAV9GAU7_9PEZI|nr:DNA-directed RNA polymerase I subunit RPA34.5-domain-containing protein [Podospora aff. communis PSN243]